MTATDTRRRAEFLDEQAKIIKALKTIEKAWPKGLWLFANGMNLYLMREHPDGSRHAKNGSMDDTLVVTSFQIPCDGGDW